MNPHEFLQAIVCRANADAANLRALSGRATCDLHLFFGEAVLSYQMDAGDWQDLPATIENIGEDVDATRERAGGRL